jgi:hypothetical protein
MPKFTNPLEKDLKIFKKPMPNKPSYKNKKEGK